MPSYVFTGVVLPERAQISLSTELAFSHIGSGTEGRARVSIINNSVAVFIDSTPAWDIFDLRNVVASIVQNELAMVGYLKGYAYDLEITRVVGDDSNTDYVFGIDIPCLSERLKGDIAPALAKLRAKVGGEIGVHLQRCFGDLVSAMRDANDTAFYCYRAIESLCHHCAALKGLADAAKPAQWAAFRAAAGVAEQPIREIQAAANPLRHGQIAVASSADRAKLFTATWDIVDAYIQGV